MIGDRTPGEMVQKGAENMEMIISSGNDFIKSTYTPAYIDAVFTLWYSHNKPPVPRLVSMLPNPAEFGIAHTVPSSGVVHRWVRDIFLPRAAALDEEVSRQLTERLVAEKVAMLEKHAEIAQEMQGMSLQYLRENREKLNPNAAVRLLVEGVRIERESRGIPAMLSKLTEMSDEQLVKQIESALMGSDVSIEPLPDLGDE